MNRIHMLLIVSIFSCNIISAAAPKEIDYEGFYEAIKENDIGRVQSFLEQGANVNCEIDGQTPLHEASFFGHVTLAEMFLERGASINEKTDLRDTSLMLAVLNGHIKLVGLLLAKGADVKAEDHFGNTSLHIAACNNNEEVARILLEFGANKSVKNACGATAAERARRNGHNELADFIESWEPLEIKEPGDD